MDSVEVSFMSRNMLMMVAQLGRSAMSFPPRDTIIESF